MRIHQVRKFKRRRNPRHSYLAFLSKTPKAKSSASKRRIHIPGDNPNMRAIISESRKDGTGFRFQKDAPPLIPAR